MHYTGEDRSVHHAASCLLLDVVELGGFKVAQPFVTPEFYEVVAPLVAEPLIVSGGVPCVSSWWR